MKPIRLIALSLCITLSLFAQQRWIDQFYPRPVFHIKPSDEEKLMYFSIEDHFDTAAVGCMIGEFRLLFADGTERFIPILYQPIPDEGLAGQTEPGKDEFLAGFARTQSFTIPENAQLFFFRSLLRVVTTDQEIMPQSQWNALLRRWDDYLWITPPGWILDTVIFVIELCRASDGQRMALLDSVGILPNPDSWYIQPFGTEILQNRHFRSLPAQYAGTKAFIRIVPYRYGPIPLGLKLFRVWSWCSFSTLRDFDSVSLTTGWQDWRIRGDDWDSLYAAYYEQLRAYLDSGLAASGKLPPHSPMLFTEEIKQDYLARYWGIDPEEDDFLHNPEKTAEILKKKKATPIASFAASSTIQIDVQQPGSAALLISITSPERIPNATLSLLDGTGKRVAELWRGELPAGSFQIELPIPSQLATGRCWVLLSNPQGPSKGRSVQIQR